jgi:hypothetical protein
MFLRQTMSLSNTMLQIFCRYCLWRPYQTIIITIIIISSDSDAIISSDRIAATMYSLKTWFISEIYVQIPCIKEIVFLSLIYYYSNKRLKQCHSAAGRIMSMKNSNDTIGNRSRDLPVCSAVPQPLRHRVPLHEDVAYRNQDGLTWSSKTEGNGVVENGGRMPRLEVAGDICLRRSRSTEGCRDDENRASSFT